MIIATWNIRGLNSAPKQDEVVKLIRKNKLDALGILETHTDTSRLNQFVGSRLRGWKVVNNFDVIDRWRIALVWNPDKVELTMLDILPQVIHVSIICKISRLCFVTSFVYGASSKVIRRELWNGLLQFQPSSNQSWLLVGDFNTLLKCEERINCVPVLNCDIKDFDDCCSMLIIKDIASAGFYFTWNNRAIWSKLDRAMVNENRLHSDLHLHAVFLPPGCSNHSPCIVSVLGQESKKGSPWRFLSMWLEHETYMPLVESAWNVTTPGTSQYRLFMKLKLTKEALKDLSKEHYDHIADRAEAAREQLKSAQQRIHDAPNDAEMIDALPLLRKTAADLSLAEKRFYQQKARCTFQLQSDKCTKFFHSMVKRNAKMNHIASLTRDDASYTTTSEEVVTEFVNYFTQLLGVRDNTDGFDMNVIRNGSLIKEDQVEALMAGIIESEIILAFSSMAEDKAPGPDGFSVIFLRRSWSIVGREVCLAVNEFFTKGRLLRQLNHTVLTLVPKSSHSAKVSDYRPIACCNAVYKIISKINATHLGSVLGTIIDDAQGAFVKGRNMVDNIHLM